MLGESQEQGEVSRETGVKEGSDAGENLMWQNASTGS